jgi:PPOX class probable F420-dependent enzyme
MQIPPVVRAAVEAGPLAHVVTLARDGSPQITLAWIGLDGDEVVIATMFDQPKCRNLRRDPRVAISFRTGAIGSMGLDQYFVLHGKARLTEGGAPELLQQLAQTYIGPGTVYPPFPNPPAGWIIHITVERITGSDPVTPGR